VQGREPTPETPRCTLTKIGVVIRTPQATHNTRRHRISVLLPFPQPTQTTRVHPRYPTSLKWKPPPGSTSPAVAHPTKLAPHRFPSPSTPLIAVNPGFFSSREPWFFLLQVQTALRLNEREHCSTKIVLLILVVDITIHCSTKNIYNHIHIEYCIITMIKVNNTPPKRVSI
jgi:hypothetical protein